MQNTNDREIQRSLAAKFRPICAAFPGMTLSHFFCLLTVAWQGQTGLNWKNWQDGLGMHGVSMPILTELEREWSMSVTDARNETIFNQAKKKL